VGERRTAERSQRNQRRTQEKGKNHLKSFVVLRFSLAYASCKNMPHRVTTYAVK